MNMLVEKCHFHAKTMYWVNIPMFTPGDIIQHFKRTMMSKEDIEHDVFEHLYIFIGYARSTESNDIQVVFRAMKNIDDSINVFVCSLDKFLSKVDKKAYPDAKQDYVFVSHFGGAYEY